MTRTCRLALGLSAAFLLGCIRADQSLTINRDGSAEFDVTYSMAEQTITQLKAMRKLREELRAAADRPPTASADDDFLYLLIDPEEQDIRDELMKYEKDGLEIKEVETETRNAWRHTRIKLACKDINRIAKTPIFVKHGFSLVKTADDNYLLARSRNNVDAATAPDFADSETLRLLGPLLAGFNVTLGIRVPGRILKTNATRHSLYSAAWVFDFNRDHNAVTAFHNHKIRVVFQGKGLSLAEIRQ